MNIKVLCTCIVLACGYRFSVDEGLRFSMSDTAVENHWLREVLNSSFNGKSTQAIEVSLPSLGDPQGKLDLSPGNDDAMNAFAFKPEGLMLKYLFFNLDKFVTGGANTVSFIQLRGDVGDAVKMVITSPNIPSLVPETATTYTYTKLASGILPREHFQTQDGYEWYMNAFNPGLGPGMNPKKKIKTAAARKYLESLKTSQPCASDPKCEDPNVQGWAVPMDLKDKDGKKKLGSATLHQGAMKKIALLALREAG